MEGTKHSRLILKLTFVGGLLLILNACNEKGRMEKAGESVDKKIEDAGEAIEDAGDNIKKETSR